MSFATELVRAIVHSAKLTVGSRFGRYASWPPKGLTIDEPLALAENRMNKLERIYAKAMRNTWDGPTIIREAVARHNGIQLSREKRMALVYPLSMLMWGELAAWIVSAELTERLEDPDARMAASSQVFDEARHFYTLRDYVAMLHVPIPPVDPYFGAAARTLLSSRDLVLKLFAMQILAEGTAQSIFQFLGQANVEPVLTDILPYIERDEARHVGLGILHLPQLLAQRTPAECRKLARKVEAIGALFGATQIRYVDHYRAIGLDPRDLFRSCDKMLYGLASKLGKVPGTDRHYFNVPDPRSPDYETNLDFILPRPGQRQTTSARLLKGVIDVWGRALERAA